MDAADSVALESVDGAGESARTAGVVRRAVNEHWHITDAIRDDLVREMHALAVTHRSPRVRIAAARTVILMDQVNAKRERSQVDERQGNAALSLAAVRAALAAQLAGDPTLSIRLAGGDVIPSLPCPTPPLASPTSDALTATATVALPGSTASPQTAPTFACATCEDAGVVVSSRGACACPECGPDAPRGRTVDQRPKRSGSRRVGGLVAHAAEAAPTPADPGDLAY